MSAPIMVDSSWYIAESRMGRDPLVELSRYAESRDIATCGMIMTEVGRGLRERRYLQKYLRAWRRMLYVPSSQSLWENTLQLAWNLDREGKVLPLQDIHIAICAAQAGAVILTVDTHFDQIPGILATNRIV